MLNVNIFLVAAFLFYLGSLTGWLIELFFRRFLSKNNPERKWINPGFCVGPYIPLYGFGLVILCITTYFAEKFVPPTWVGVIVMILVMVVTITVLEYVAGIFALKVANIRLWDYSKEWGNIHGLICPKFSLIWGGAATLYIFFLHPIYIDEVAWLSEHLSFSFVVGLFFGIFLIDVAYSSNLTNKIIAFAKSEDLVVNIEHLKSSVVRKDKEEDNKSSFAFPLKNKNYIVENLHELKENASYSIKTGKIKKSKKDEK